MLHILFSRFSVLLFREDIVMGFSIIIVLLITVT